MKNHIAFKFIAILLCALSLLGSVGSALAIFVLTEGDLYDRTVEELYQENVQLFGSDYANTLALRYAGSNLGGCPDALLDAQLWTRAPFVDGSYGYRILDAKGNVLESVDLPEAVPDTTYTFDVSGQYMYLVSVMPESERYPQETAASDPDQPVMAEGAQTIENLSPSGTPIDRVEFTSLGETTGVDITGEGFLGVAFRGENGTVIFHSYNHLSELPLGQVSHVWLCSQGEVVYAAGSEEGVGTLELDEFGNHCFVSYALAQEEEAEETVAETVPETIPETIPDSTEATIEETEPIETDLKIVDNIPEDGCEVAGMKVTLADGTTFSHVDKEGLGKIYYSSLNAVCFRSYEMKIQLIDGRSTATYVHFWNAQEDTIFEASYPEGLGDFFYNENSRLTFVSEKLDKLEEDAMERALAPAQETEAAEETAAEETTVEETVAEETQPETTEVPKKKKSSASAEPTLATEATEASAEYTEALEATAVTEAVNEPEETVPEVMTAVAEPVTVNGRSLDEFEINRTTYMDNKSGQVMYAEYVYTPMPEYTVQLYLAPNALPDAYLYTVLKIVRGFRNDLFLALGLSLLVLAVTVVYLCSAAARNTKNNELRADGLNCLPLDLYAIVMFFGVALLAAGGMEGSVYLLRQDTMVGCGFALAMGFLACLLVVGFGFAAVAQFKTPGGYWWRNSVCGWFMRLCFKFSVWAEAFMAEKGFPFLGRHLKKLWKFTCAVTLWLFRNTEKLLLKTGRFVGKVFQWCSGKLQRFLSLLPLTWQWLMAGFLIFLLIAIMFGTNGEEFLVVLCMGGCIAIIVYGAHCFGILWESTKRMGKGDLDSKVEDKLLLGSFKDFAADLNDLAGVAVVAAQKQLKSERMKTELITNVSHDIKTPLTSIINYVDLLQKPHTEEEQDQYLEVLDRQSQRLKKLIEDLMEMSKASTGNMAVEVTRVDAVESVNQALGEFADKLEKAELIPVFRHSQDSVAMMADGRLVWRVMSNLLSNAVKYAMPGTRMYVDLMELEGKVVISIKNISRDSLNVGADELMERFVRGDCSRNTEGSGLGLNIAKSLMELQKGQLQLLVDGDLFKVTLIFPGA